MPGVKDLLGEVPIFEGLADADLNVVAQRVRQIHRKEDSTIFHRREPGVALYLIVTGKVKIHNETPDGSDTIIAIMNEGDFFGELALLDGEERSADATTLEPTELLMLTKDDFHDILQRNPRISLRILATLAGRLRRTTDAYLAHSTLDVNGRLAMQLLRLSDQNGRVTKDGIRIELRLTQTDLGALVGASRESVNKVFGSFRRQGLVAIDDKGQILLRNPEALRKLCNRSGL